MASSRHHRKGASGRKPFASSARAAYVLAADITEAGRYFARERRLLAAVASDGPTSGAVEAAEGQLARLEATREWFEGRLLEDPSGAVAELKRVRKGLLDVRGVLVGRLLDAPRSAAVRSAVLHVAEWIARQQRGEHRGFSMPVATLGSVASARKVENEDDLKRLLRTGPVQKALRGDGAKKRGGPKDAAIALVALATGVGESTVKRAAGSKRAED